MHMRSASLHNFTSKNVNFHRKLEGFGADIAHIRAGLQRNPVSWRLITLHSMIALEAAEDFDS